MKNLKHDSYRFLFSEDSSISNLNSFNGNNKDEVENAIRQSAAYRLSAFRSIPDRSLFIYGNTHEPEGDGTWTGDGSLCFSYGDRASDDRHTIVTISLTAPSNEDRTLQINDDNLSAPKDLFIPSGTSKLIKFHLVNDGKWHKTIIKIDNAGTIKNSGDLRVLGVKLSI